MAASDRAKGRPEPIRLLNLVPERENGEALVNVQEYAPRVRLARPQVVPYVRKTVAVKLDQASKRMPPGVYFGLIEGWRPIERQQRIWDFMWKSAEEAFPHRDRGALRRTVCRWVAPTDQKAPPGHCTGAAVDVHLIDEEGELIEVCAPFTRHEAASTYTLGLTECAHKNRMLLVEAMLSVGFSNCRDEWWHYSYGDAGWAVRLAKPECFYGLARLDPKLYEELERLSIEGFKDRVNPFLPPA